MTTDVRSHIHVYVVDGNTHHIQLKINNLNFVYLQSCVGFVWLNDSRVSFVRRVSFVLLIQTISQKKYYVIYMYMYKYYEQPFDYRSFWKSDGHRTLMDRKRSYANSNATRRSTNTVNIKYRCDFSIT